MAGSRPNRRNSVGRSLMTILAVLVRLILGAVFLMSALTKVSAPGRFAEDVRQYRILPGSLSTVFAWSLLLLELSAALLLLGGFLVTWASLAVVAMLLTFMAAVGIAMARGDSLSCACFGLLYRERVGWPTQLRDGALLAMALFVLLFDGGSPTVTDMATDLGSLGHALGLAATAAVLLLGLFVAALSIAQDRRNRAGASAEHHGPAPIVESTDANALTSEGVSEVPSPLAGEGYTN